MTIPDSGDMMEYGSIELPCSAEEERKIVRELTDKAEANPREGDSYYVISSRWFLSWQRYTGELFGAYVSGESNTEVQPSMTADRPGSIDNSGIVAIKSDDGKPQLIRTLEEGADYTLVPHEVWDRLHRWYGGGPVICRKMISAGDSKQLCVEVFPLCLYIIDSRDKSQTVIHLSKKAALNELYETVCRVKALELEKARIWDYFNEEKNALLAASSQTLEECNLQMDQHILVEVQNDGSWPSGFGMDSTGNGLALVPVEPSRSSLTIAGGPALSNGYTTGSNSNMYEGITLNSAYGGSALSNGYTTGSNSNMNEVINSAFGDMEDGRSSNCYTTGSKSRSVSSRERGGLAGLQNLGNTCFMNSSLQCLVHTPQIAEYFLNDYTNEINKQNPLGTRGELAVAFGELLRKLWSSGRTAVAPRAFKGKLARFAPQFSGYNQHDSQELLAFLLDGLHEDLNRVKQKPYSETKDSDARPDEELANEFWSYHKARNDSVIVDVCQGQYKSTLVCPECNKISITFDPFMYLSLPLPSTATRTMTISVFYADGSGLPIPFTVTVLKHGCCKDLIQSLSSACCLSADEYLLLAEVYEHRIYRYLENPSELLATIKDEEYIVAYRLPKSSSNLTRLEISHRYLEKSILDNLRTGQRKGFLTPLVTFIEDVKSGIDIDQAVGRALAPLKRRVFSPSAAVYNGSRKEEEVSSSSIGITQSVECVDMEEDASVTEMSFHLCTTDDRGLGCKPVLKDTPIERGRSLKVVLDWTDKEKELYDSSFLKDLPEVHKSGLTVKKTKQEAISLFSCLDAFLKEEPLGPDDMWYCPRCKEHRQATKKLDLWRLPDILVFHLKRFSYNRWLKNKLDTFVNFPVRNLDLSKYVKSKEASEGGDHVYELYAISNHYGGLGGGHYSAYCKIIDDEAWYHFDDSHVSRVNEEEIKTSAAYVLFYQRVRNQNQPDGSTTTTGDSLLLSSS